MPPIPVTTLHAGQTPASILPFVSVIIPTQNRRLLLLKTLTSLAAQHYPADRFEVLVVDGGSNDGTTESVLAFARTSPMPVRYSSCESQGPAARRNLGARQASGAILAFTDSDCAPQPEWLRAGVAAMVADSGPAIVHGPVTPPGSPSDLSDLELPCSFLWISQPTGMWETANILYRRDDFWTAGGFPEDYPFGFLGHTQGGDDADLGWRLRRLGRNSVFREDVVVVHAVTPCTWWQWLTQVVKFIPLGLILRRCPETRSFLTLGVFYPIVAAPQFKLVLLAVPMAFVSPFFLVLVLPYLHFWLFRAYRSDLRRVRRWPKLARNVLAWSLWNLALSAALLFSSLRYRRLVL